MQWVLNSPNKDMFIKDLFKFKNTEKDSEEFHPISSNDAKIIREQGYLENGEKKASLVQCSKSVIATASRLFFLKKKKKRRSSLHSRRFCASAEHTRCQGTLCSAQTYSLGTWRSRPRPSTCSSVTLPLSTLRQLLSWSTCLQLLLLHGNRSRPGGRFSSAFCQPCGSSTGGVCCSCADVST